MIHFDHSTVSLTGKIQRVSGTVDLEINLSDKGRVTKINALKQAKLSDYIGTMMVVLFAPEDLQLVKGHLAFVANLSTLTLVKLNLFTYLSYPIITTCLNSVIAI